MQGSASRRSRSAGNMVESIERYLSLGFQPLPAHAIATRSKVTNGGNPIGSTAVLRRLRGSFRGALSDDELNNVVELLIDLLKKDGHSVKKADDLCFVEKIANWRDEDASSTIYFEGNSVFKRIAVNKIGRDQLLRKFYQVHQSPNKPTQKKKADACARLKPTLPSPTMDFCNSHLWPPLGFRLHATRRKFEQAFQWDPQSPSPHASLLPQQPRPSIPSPMSKPLPPASVWPSDCNTVSLLPSEHPCHLVAASLRVSQSQSTESVPQSFIPSDPLFQEGTSLVESVPDANVNVKLTAASKPSSQMAAPLEEKRPSHTNLFPESESPSLSSAYSLDYPLSPFFDIFSPSEKSNFSDGTPIEPCTTNLNPLTVQEVPSHLRLPTLIIEKRELLRKHCLLHGIHDVRDNFATLNMDALLTSAEVVEDEEMGRRLIDMIIEFWDRDFTGTSMTVEKDDDEKVGNDDPVTPKKRHPHDNPCHGAVVAGSNDASVTNIALVKSPDFQTMTAASFTDTVEILQWPPSLEPSPARLSRIDSWPNSVAFLDDAFFGFNFEEPTLCTNGQSSGRKQENMKHRKRKSKSKR